MTLDLNPKILNHKLPKGNYVNMERTLVVGDRLDTDMAFGKVINLKPKNNES